MSYTSTGALTSSKDQTWTTPPRLLDQLHEEFHFTRDLASSPDTYAAAKIGKCWTPADDSLSKSWEGETGFLNPPYGRELAAWIAKAAEEVASAEQDTTIVLLIPARPDTAIWQDVILRQAREIRFIRGRLRFGGGEMPAPFPSAIVVFSNTEPTGYALCHRQGKEPCEPSFSAMDPRRI